MRLPTLPCRARAALPDDLGQSTTEYALMMLAAGTIALGVLGWAHGTGTFTDMFESVINRLTGSM